MRKRKQIFAKMATSKYLTCSIRTVFTLFSLIFILSITNFIFFNKTHITNSQNTLKDPTFFLKVFLFELPRSLNYDLVHKFYTLPESGSTRIPHKSDPYPPYPAYRQSSAEYWLLGDLMTHENWRNGSFAKRVFDVEEADVVFVPFFASLSVGIQISENHYVTGMKDRKNADYVRQKQVIDLVMSSDAWKRSGGRNFVFVLTDPMSMLHVKDEIAPSTLLVVDFGAWFMLEPIETPGKPTKIIPHTRVSLLKDVIVPYTHLLPKLHLSEDQPRHNLLYFKGGLHRSRGGAIRGTLWKLLVKEPGVIMEEGRPFASGVEQSIPGMRSSEFCLDPAGDTPTSCRLFDAIQSLCIPVIVSDHIELPFEGMINYSEFSIFVSEKNAVQPKWLMNHLNNISKTEREEYRRNMARVQPMFEYDNGYPGGIGPTDPNGAVNLIWKKIYQKVPMIKEAVTRDRRKPPGTSIPLRCQCT